MEMGYIDIVILIVLAVGIIRGWHSGFVGQAARLTGWVLAFLFASLFMDAAGAFLESHGWAPPEMGTLIAFAAIFIAVKVASTTVAKSLDAAVKSLHLGGVNRLAGSAAGALKSAVLLSLVLIVSAMAQLPSKADIAKSSFYEPVFGIAPAAWEILSNGVPHLENLKDDIERRVDLRSAGIGG